MVKSTETDVKVHGTFLGRLGGQKVRLLLQADNS
jgi:hypothetical protein